MTKEIWTRRTEREFQAESDLIVKSICQALKVDVPANMVNFQISIMGPQTKITWQEIETNKPEQ